MRFVLLAALLGAGSAGAECPTRDALAGGASAFVLYPDDSIVELQWLGEGMVEETTRSADGSDDFRMISMGGVFIVDEIDLDGEDEMPETRITTRYPEDLLARLPVQPNQAFDVHATNLYADGPEAEDEFIELRSGGLDEIDIAGCRYRGFPMLLTYHWGDDWFTSMMTHLPDLGLSLEIARMDMGEDPVPFAPRFFGLERP